MTIENKISDTSQEWDFPKPPQIADRHWEEWVMESAISPEIALLNLRSLHDAREVDELLNRNTNKKWKHSEELVPAWAVTGLHPIGWERVSTGCQVKPDTAQVDPKSGKIRKYFSPSKEESYPLFLEVPEAEFWEKVLKDTCIPLFIVEGAKKAAALLSLGFAAISVPGVWNCRKGDKIHDWLKSFCYGRKVYVGFDGDWRENSGVRSAIYRWGRLLASEGAVPFILDIPQDTKGIDDFIVQGGDVQDLINDASTAKDFEKRSKAEVLFNQQDAERTPIAQSKTKQAFNKIRAVWGDRLRYNSMKKIIELDGEKLPLDRINIKIANHFDIDISKDKASDIVIELALLNQYNPFQEYLESLPHQDSSFLDDLVARYFHNHNPLHQILLKRTLVAAVARTYEPGCKHDSICILYGEQDLGKSTFWETLASKPMFCDDLSGSEKDEILKISQYLIIEFAEFAKCYKKKDIETLKAFLSRKVDSVRRPYGRDLEDIARPSIFVGTTNRKDILRDPTGERRYWVIPVYVDSINLDLVKAERDAIWAAAKHAYEQGTQWWLTKDEKRQLNDSNDDFKSVDVWEEMIASWLGGRKQIGINQILTDCLRFEASQINSGHSMRVADVLTGMGWRKGKRKAMNGKKIQLWEKAQTTPKTEVCPQNSEGMSNGSNPDTASARPLNSPLLDSEVCPRYVQCSNPDTASVSEDLDIPGHTFSSNSDKKKESSLNSNNLESFQPSVCPRGGNPPIKQPTQGFQSGHTLVDIPCPENKHVISDTPIPDGHTDNFRDLKKGDIIQFTTPDQKEEEGEVIDICEGLLEVKVGEKGITLVSVDKIISLIPF